MSKQQDIWQSEYYAIPKKYMSLVGIWPYDDIRKRYLRFIPSFTFSFSIIMPQVSFIIFGTNDLTAIFESIPSIIITTIFSYKVFRLMLNDKKVMACMKAIENDWKSLESNMERTILHDRARYGQRVTSFYKTLMLLTLFFYSTRPVLVTLLGHESSLNTSKSRIAGQEKLPYLVDYGKFNEHFYLILFHGFAAVFYHVFITIAVDTLYQTLIQHACGMFTIIGFADLIESTYTDVLLVSVNLNVIAGSLVGIQVVMNLQTTAENIAAPLSIYIAQLNHLFLQFWQAQFLMDYSILPYESMGTWYFTSRRCQKILLFIMFRAVIPCKITAGKILTLSIETFSNVMKTSMSYFTMLQSFQ